MNKINKTHIDSSKNCITIEIVDDNRTNFKSITFSVSELEDLINQKQEETQNDVLEFVKTKKL